MKKIGYSIAVFMSAVSLMSCSKSDSKSTDQKVTPASAGGYTGAWLEEKDASEFRQTGRLDSMCADIREKGIATNAFLVKDNGRVTLYTETVEARELIHVGDINSSTNMMVFDPEFIKGLGIPSTVPTTLNGDLLSMTLQQKVEFRLVRSNDAELTKYYQAQEACLH